MLLKRNKRLSFSNDCIWWVSACHRTIQRYFWRVKWQFRGNWTFILQELKSCWRCSLEGQKTWSFALLKTVLSSKLWRALVTLIFHLRSDSLGVTNAIRYWWCQSDKHHLALSVVLYGSTFDCKGERKIGFLCIFPFLLTCFQRPRQRRGASLSPSQTDGMQESVLVLSNSIWARLPP